MRKVVVLVGAVVFVDTTFFAAITPLLPRYEEQFELTKASAGILTAAYPLGTLLGSIPGGWLATRIGVRPTVDQSGRVSIETHIFDLARDIYGSAIRVSFVQRLRDERKFESLDALRAQIDADCGRARVLFDRLSL